MSSLGEKNEFVGSGLEVFRGTSRDLGLGMVRGIQGFGSIEFRV